MRTTTRLFSLAAVLTLALACGDDGDDSTTPMGDGAGAGVGDGVGDGDGDGDAFTLSFTGNGYAGAHAGQTILFALWDDADDSAPVATDEVVADADPLTVEFADTLEAGGSYTLYFYADADDDGVCNDGQPDNEHNWSEAAASVSADVEIIRDHDIEFDGDCTKHE
jgi:hypothetical protein